MKLLAALFVAASLLLVPVQQVAACTCAMPNIDESVAMADAVFAGTVLNEQPVGVDTGPVGALAATAPGPFPFGQVVYAVAVDGVAKGDVGAEASVVSSIDGASCGMTFAVGQRYLFFTTWDGAVHSTGLCSGNLSLGPDEDPPLPMAAPTGEPLAAEPAEVPWTIIILLGVVGLVVAVSIVAFRRDPPVPS